MIVFPLCLLKFIHSYIEFVPTKTIWAIRQQRKRCIKFPSSINDIIRLKLRLYIIMKIRSLMESSSIHLDTDESWASAFKFFFFFFFQHILAFQWSVYCLRDPQTYFFNETFIKNRSYDIIHIFKNYFAIVFSAK